MEKRLLLKNKDNETSVAVFGVPSDKFNLQMAMKEAAAEYCRTEIGRRDFEKGMNYQDFMNWVPDVLCIKQGFTKLGYLPGEVVKDEHDLLLNAEEIQYLEDCANAGFGTMLNVHQVELQMTRIWGMKEAKRKYPAMEKVFGNTQKKNGETLLDWAEEYVVSKSDNVEDFLNRKIVVALQSA